MMLSRAPVADLAFDVDEWFRSLHDQRGSILTMLERARVDARCRGDVWPQVRREILAHDRIDLVSATRILGDSPELEALVGGHASTAGGIVALVATIDRLDPSSEDWRDAISDLQALFIRQSALEENQVVPQARRLLGVGLTIESPDKARSVPDSMTAKLRVIVVDDHPVFRQGLSFVVARESDLEVVGEASDAAEAEILARGVVIDVAVVDVMMPLSSGISVCNKLAAIQPRCRILGLSVIDEPGLVADMLRAGASGYALKTQRPDEIVDAIRQIARGARYLPPTMSRDEVERALRDSGDHVLDRLTPRELEIFELLIRGYSNDEVSLRLTISRRTVETHRSRITKKLSAHSVIEMQRLAAVHSWSRA